MTWPPLVLLGPQRRRPNLRATLDSLGLQGPFAVVTAGWEERESEVEELAGHVDQPVVNLELYRRADDVFRQDPDLLQATRERLDLMRSQQELYRLRLRHSLQATRELFSRPGPARMLDRERAAAIVALQELDGHHLEVMRQHLEEFEQEHDYGTHPEIQRHRDEVREQLRPCTALLVAGGHVGVLRNRLHMFDLPAAAEDRPLVAWSAGAMCLGARLVLFHDNPPQGPGDAEVLRPGLDAFQGLLPLPHARRRLRLDDPVRVRVFARRFAPDLCVALDDGCRVDRTEEGWTLAPGTRQLTTEGSLTAAGRP